MNSILCIRHCHRHHRRSLTASFLPLFIGLKLFIFVCCRLWSRLNTKRNENRQKLINTIGFGRHTYKNKWNFQREKISACLVCFGNWSFNSVEMTINEKKKKQATITTSRTETVAETEHLFHLLELFFWQWKLICRKWINGENDNDGVSPIRRGENGRKTELTA